MVGDLGRRIASITVGQLYFVLLVIIYQHTTCFSSVFTEATTLFSETSQVPDSATIFHDPTYILRANLARAISS